jgi:pyruvate/2-oxoglutarate dehydrogenase complex dihydrolipoamide dehydrogenase (E3) component
MESYDFAVIGGGSAGYAAAAAAARLGLRTCCIEGGKDLGGLCILHGCMPSKTLLESANRFRTLRRADEFGLRTGKIGYSAESIIQRKRRFVEGFAAYRAEQLRQGRFQFIRGKAQFLDPHRLRIQHLRAGGESSGRTSELAMRTALIATGSEIDVIDLPGLSEAGFLTSDSALDVESIPSSCVILGGGAIALEFAHYYESFGSRVTIIQRSRQLLKEADADVAEALTEAYRHRGMDIYCGTKLLGVTRNGQRTVHFEQDGTRQAGSGEELFYALGRRPTTAHLGLPEAGVQQDGRGAVGVMPSMQTTQPNLFAAGDVTGTWEVVHLAIEQGVLAAHNAFRLLQGKPLQSVDNRLKLFAMFSEPQVAFVGLTEREAAAEGLAVRRASYPFSDHGKALVHGEPEGFVKLLCVADTGEIVGGAVVGPAASELIHEITVAMHFRATAAQLASIPHYHPTLSEIWTYPAEALAEAITG